MKWYSFDPHRLIEDEMFFVNWDFIFTHPKSKKALKRGYIPPAPERTEVPEKLPVTGLRIA